MNRKKDPCRNFMRGSCQYGDRCKFSHAINIQQQTNPNPIGFGAFAQQPRGAASPFAAVPKQQFKPFENKWTRTPDAATPTFTKQQSNDQQSQSANHICNDPQSCKRIMAEDFQKERPIWILTCYAHFKHLPCDISGDISYEELRAMAYNDAKNGIGLPHIVERERNLLNSKLIEFENLLRNSYAVPSNTVTAKPSSFLGSNITASPETKAPPSVSSFSQLGITKNQGSNASTVAPLNSSFGQQSPFPVASQAVPSNTGFGEQNPFPVSSQTSTSQSSFAQQNAFPFPSQNTTSNSFFGQRNPFPVSSQTSGSVAANNPNFGAQGLFGNQVQLQGTASGFNSPFGFGSNVTASKTGLLQSSNAASNQPPIFASGGIDASGGQMGKSQEDVPGDIMSIWFKEKWDPGEIPEDAPPEKVCF